MSMNSVDVLKKSILSEKSTMAGDANNYYTFIVDKRANKFDIKKAVESLYDVKVGKVKTLRTDKIKKFKMRTTKVQEKKAYVQVLDDASIVFEVETSAE